MTLPVADINHFRRPVAPADRNSPVIPAQAGIQGRRTVPEPLDFGFRRSDERRRPFGRAIGATSPAIDRRRTPGRRP